MKRTVVLFISCGLLGAYVVGQQHNTDAKPASTHHMNTTQPVPSPQEIWADLVQGNQRFVAGTPKTRGLVSLRNSLAESQHPKVVVLTCSDSRVSPEVLFDQSLGDLFVVRSAGNIADAIGVGSIEYAVEHLGSSVLVVLGHTRCGAVTAACSKEKMPTPNLQAIFGISPSDTPDTSRAREARNRLIRLCAVPSRMYCGVIDRFMLGASPRSVARWIFGYPVEQRGGIRGLAA